jgi:hypothetical protein
VQWKAVYGDAEEESVACVVQAAQHVGLGQVELESIARVS